MSSPEENSSGSRPQGGIRMDEPDDRRQSGTDFSRLSLCCPGAARAAGRGDPARIRRPGQPDRPAGDLAGPRGPALDGPAPPGGPRFTFTATSQPGPPGGYGNWRLSTGTPGPRDLLIALGPVRTENCDHRHEATGHDPVVMLRHLTQVRYATCTGPGCRRPAARADYEHNTPYEAGGRTCLYNGNPTCRDDHRVKQDPRWHAEQLPSGHIRWTTPSGRQCVTELTRHPI
jgi:hypothetical protein